MCCGSPQRSIATGGQRLTRSSAMKSQPNKSVQMQATHTARSLFEYVGATALTVVSPLTRRIYRFEQSGSRVEVDARDRSWVAFVPNLARVRE